MPITKEYITLSIEDIIPYENNPRINDDAVAGVVESIKQCGELDPIEVDENNVILSGHTRLLAYKELEYKQVSVLKITGLTEPQKRKYRLLTNKTGEVAAWDFDKLGLELEGLDFDGFDFGFDVDLPSLEEDGQKEVVEDDYDEEPLTEPKAKLGDLWQLGSHRLICGDSTDVNVIDRLMNGEKADMVFTDPPYGMLKENQGIKNDSLDSIHQRSKNKLLEFNKQWIPLTFGALKDNGSWYCWGIDEPLMDIYCFILKPYIESVKLTFRNFITWDKGNGQGQKSKLFRQYPVASEKCLFCQCGFQEGFNNNGDDFDMRFEPIRKYIENECIKCDINDAKKFNSILSATNKYQHLVTQSHWYLAKEKDYLKLREYAETKGIKAFQKPYKELENEYNNLWAFFDNTHDNMNDVWHFDRTSKEEREQTGGHATPKPIALCARAIKSSSRGGEIVLDVFGGSGSTLIACEQLNRKCYMAELDPKYVSVILQRYINFKGSDADVFLLKDGEKIPYSKVKS